MITIELARQTDLAQPLRMETLRQPLYSGDSMAHRICVSLRRGQDAVDASDCMVMGYFLRADGATVVIPGEAQGSSVSLTWPRACYEVPGHFSFILRLTDNDQVQQTVLALQGSVAMTSTDSLVDVSQAIPSLDDLLQQIYVLERATDRANAMNDQLQVALESGQFDGRGLTILGYFQTEAELAQVSNPQRGDAYGVGSAAPYDIYVWDGVNSAWVNNGPLQVERITVCGMPAVNGNIHLTAADIPCGNYTTAKAIENAAARSMPALLWEGAWSGGEITVPGIQDWKVVQVATSVGSALCFVNTVVQGIGCSSGASLHRTIMVRFALDGDVCTFTAAHYVNHTSSGDHGAMTSVNITAIYGLIRKEA